MDMPVKVLGILCITLSLLFMSLDIYKNQQMIQSEFESNRSANQGSLLDLQEKYNNNETLSTVEMLNAWLVNFINTHGLAYENVRLGFVQMESDPPLYLVTIEGYEDDYAILTKDAYVRYTSGAMIITDDEEE